MSMIDERQFDSKLRNFALEEPNNDVPLRRFGARRAATQQSSPNFAISSASQFGAVGFQSNLFTEPEGARSRPVFRWNQT
jgi:hypothetical protein